MAPSRTAATYEAPVRTRRPATWAYFALFFVSGFPALLYQIVWQRALFTIYGVNIESVTMIVTVFMLGLGFGSLAGGNLSSRPGLRPLPVFGAIELCIGTFGALSLWFFQKAASASAGASIPATGAITFGLLLIPTLLMGSTLPLLAAHFVRHTRNVGEAVGALYCVNTLGSAVACFAAAFWIMRLFGESGSVRLAAVLNAAVGISAIALHFRTHKREDEIPAVPERPTRYGRKTIPLGVGMALAAAAGFIALAYEIIWYRLYAFTTGGAAPCFAQLLGFYLAGIAYGSFAIRDLCRKELKDDFRRTAEAAATTVLFGSIAGFLLGPALSFFIRFLPYSVTFTFVFIGAALMGAGFPLLCHLAIDPSQRTGRSLSRLYMGNIAGSALGSFLIGFIVMDHWSTQATSLFLLGLGVAVSVILISMARPIRPRPAIVIGVLTCLSLAMLAQPLYAGMFERLLYKDSYAAGTRFKDLVENRSGVIAVDQDDTVFGGGAYDGRFNTSLVVDVNRIYRGYAIAALHPRPSEVLVIGLSSGSWAQVIANLPEVEHVTVVEINPGYLPLIEKRAAVSSLLRNPKVEFVIDDGRRWLVRHPDRKFDFVLMNTTFHWRAHISNLLSVEFLRLIRQHLKPGGIHYYNTTWSAEVQATGSRVYPYSMRVGNFLAVSDGPVSLDRELWRRRLIEYRIDGQPVFNLTDQTARERLEEVLSLPDVLQEKEKGVSVESGDSIRKRTQGIRLITDDNMGTEWQ